MLLTTKEKNIGLFIKQGIYDGKHWKNITIHTTEPIKHENGRGLQAKSTKVNYLLFTQIVGKEITENDLKTYIGMDVCFFYDEYQKVKYLQLAEGK